jgi:hydroxymethylbilane synthase
MGWADRISSYIPTSQMVSAVGQGAIGIEIREDDPFMAGVMDKISDGPTMLCVTAERVVMQQLEGGCQVPIGAYARLEDDQLVMDAVVGSVNGESIVRAHLEGPADRPIALGELMVAELLVLGAGPILAQIREASTVDGLLET